MSNSKTKLYHTYSDEPPFECSTGDMTGDGFEIVLDKRTHELVIPKERETEDAVTVIVRPKGGPALVEEPSEVVTAGADVLKGGVAIDIPASPPEDGWITLPGTRMRVIPLSAERLQSGAIGAPRARVERDIAESAQRGTARPTGRHEPSSCLKVLS